MVVHPTRLAARRRPGRAARAVVQAQLPDADVRIVADVGLAVEQAHAAALDDDAVLVAGSLYTVGAARAACRRLGLARPLTSANVAVNRVGVPTQFGGQIHERPYAPRP